MRDMDHVLEFCDRIPDEKNYSPEPNCRGGGAGGGWYFTTNL